MKTIAKNFDNEVGSLKYFRNNLENIYKTLNLKKKEVVSFEKDQKI